MASRMTKVASKGLVHERVPSSERPSAFKLNDIGSFVCLCGGLVGGIIAHPMTRVTCIRCLGAQ